jgi:hypothetical protein
MIVGGLRHKITVSREVIQKLSELPPNSTTAVIRTFLNDNIGNMLTIAKPAEAIVEERKCIERGYSYNRLSVRLDKTPPEDLMFELMAPNMTALQDIKNTSDLIKICLPKYILAVNTYRREKSRYNHDRQKLLMRVAELEEERDELAADNEMLKSWKASNDIPAIEKTLEEFVKMTGSSDAMDDIVLECRAAIKEITRK